MKNILLLTYNFPPYDGGRIGSSIRTSTIANFLSSNNCLVNVVIPFRKFKDREVSYEKNINIYKYFSPFQYYDHVSGNIKLKDKILRKIFNILRKVSRKIFYNPDELYSFFVYLYCLRIIKKNKIDTIITSSPPLTVLSIGYRIKKKLKKKIKWITDIRDLVHIHPALRYKNIKSRAWQMKAEVKYICESDEIYLVSAGMKDALKKYFSDSEWKEIYKKTEIIENGYAAVKDLSPQNIVKGFVKKATAENKIVLYYAGTGELETEKYKYRNNKTLNCFIDVLVNDKKLADKFSLIIQGTVKNADNYFNNYKDKTNLKYLVIPSVSNDQIRANMKLADIGININVDREYSPLMMGGKIYDYCVSGLALLLLYPKNPVSLVDFAEKHSNKPFFADVEDSESITDILKYIAGNPDIVDLRKFTKEEMIFHSRENQYQKILETI